jgi:polyphosphate kinase 2
MTLRKAGSQVSPQLVSSESKCYNLLIERRPLMAKDKKALKEKALKEKAHKTTRAEPAPVTNGKDELSPTPAPKLDTKFYESELGKLQVELVKLQEWVKFKGLKVIVLFEGRDAAGKGGCIKRITECLNPRGCRVVALPAPTEREKSQWYFQRYVAHLPTAGEIVLFDRSWYNRAGVEHVMGFCTQEEYEDFLRSCPEFERMLVRSGVILLKYWFSVSDREQEHRFQERIADPTKRWKLSPMDLESRTRWVEYSKAKDEMFKYTDIKQAPWWVVHSDDKKRARLNCIHHLLSSIPYQDLTPEPIILPPRQEDPGYVRPPITDQTFVPEIY